MELRRPSVAKLDVKTSEEKEVSLLRLNLNGAMREVTELIEEAGTSSAKSFEICYGETGRRHCAECNPDTVQIAWATDSTQKCHCTKIYQCTEFCMVTPMTVQFKQVRCQADSTQKCHCTATFQRLPEIFRHSSLRPWCSSVSWSKISKESEKIRVSPQYHRLHLRRPLQQWARKTTPSQKSGILC